MTIVALASFNVKSRVAGHASPAARSGQRPKGEANSLHRDKLEHEDGTTVDPPLFKPTVLAWKPGETIPLVRDRTLRVINTRLDEGTDGDPVSVLVVEAA